MAKKNMVIKILYVLLILLTLYLSYWFYQNFSWVEEQKEVGFQGIAKRKPLLAAEFFLRKMGISNQQVNGLMVFREIKNTSRSILIATRRETINNELAANLVQWVEAGGHLIVESRNCDDLNNQSLEAQRQSDFIFQRFGLCDKSIDGKDSEVSPVKFKLNTLPVPSSIELSFPYREVLEQKKQPADYKVTWKIKDSLGLYAVQYSMGNGLITVLTSTDIFNNEYIAEYDHARFLLELVQFPDTENDVWLISVDDMPSLWRLLWQNAWYLMFSLSLILLLWLWRYPLRFGPVLADKPVARRKLLEHIEASAYYRWHYKQLPHLFAAVQEELWEQIQKLHPVIQREKPQQACALLAELTQLKQSDISDALMPAETINEKQFEHKVKLLGRLRHKL